VLFVTEDQLVSDSNSLTDIQVESYMISLESYMISLADGTNAYIISEQNHIEKDQIPQVTAYS
jgi:hypothetical protein